MSETVNSLPPTPAGPAALPHPNVVLATAEARYRALFDHAQVGILLADEKGYYIDANTAACRMLGYTHAELVGLHSADIIAPSDTTDIDPAIADIMARREHRREWRFRRKDGSQFAADVVGTAMPDGSILGLVRDLSDRHQAEAEANAEKQFSDRMIESMPGIVYFYDHTGRFLRWNRNFETVSGYSADEIAHMHPLQFFSDRDRPLLEARIGEVFATGESSVEADFVAKDGTATPYFFTGRKVSYGGGDCLVGVGIDISARQSAEMRIAENERKYRELVEHANSIILRWNAEGHLTFINEFGQRFFGYSAEEIIGRPVIGTIVPEVDTEGRDLARLMAEIHAAPETHEQNVNENMRRNGERAWIAWTNRIVRDGEGKVIEILSIGTDITERRRADAARREAEAKVRESEAHLAEAQRIAGIGSWEMDLRTNRLKGSDQTFAIFGLRPEEFDGTRRAFVAFVHPDDRDRLVGVLESALAGRSRFDLVHRIVLRDGREKVVHEIADLKLDAMGRPVLLAGTIHDITDRVRAESERAKRERAEAADRIKSAFLATMSHELRTPLNSIIGFTGIMLQGLAGPLNEEQSKQLGMVRGSARHLLALVNDVLDISKIEAGQLDVVRKSFDVKRSIEKVVATVTPQAEAKRLKLSADIAPAIGAAFSDERRFEQILLNLLSNAIKFTEHGTISLAAEPMPDGSLRVRVSDTGIGIKAEDMADLFQPFRQIDTGLSRVHEGTGLGLAICRRLAELMGGTISAASVWGQGSTFTFTLPLGGTA